MYSDNIYIPTKPNRFAIQLRFPITIGNPARIISVKKKHRLVPLLYDNIHRFINPPKLHSLFISNGSF